MPIASKVSIRTKAFCWALLLVGLGVNSCGDTSRAPAPPTDTVAPLVVTGPTLTVSPNAWAPLAAVVELTTNEATTVTVHLDDGIKTWDLPGSTDATTEHSIPVLGVKPGRSYGLGLRIADASGNQLTITDAFGFTMPGVPPEFPPLHVEVSNPERMDPGYTMFNANSPRSSTRKFLLIVDELGEVVWYYHASHPIMDARRLSNGNLCYQYGGHGMREIDMLGNTVQDWWAANLGTVDAPKGATLVAVDSLHHEVFELPESCEGDFLALSTEMRVLPNYPTSERDLVPLASESNVVGDVVVEFKRDGSIVQQWSMLDILDPYRLCYGSLGFGWNAHYSVTVADWSHGNAAVYLEEDDSILVCLRNQDCVIKISRATGELKWILGPHERWNMPWAEALLQPVESSEDPAPFAWSYHLHAPMLTAGGGILLFDNGNERAIPPAAPLAEQQRYSRGVEYRIDEQARTVEQVWSFGEPGAAWYSRALGDADELPQTGNVLLCDGAKPDAPNPTFGRVLEVTRDNPAQVVFEIAVRDDSNSSPATWLIYRAERLPSLYP